VGAKRGEEGLSAFCVEATHARGEERREGGVRFGMRRGGGGGGGHAE
jgi:hypothetical protein